MPSTLRPARRKKPVEPPQASLEDTAAAARAAGLRYVSDARPGIQRQKRGTGFRYLTADNEPVKDQETLRRIKSLVIPPAWRSVWISPYANGHLQATGRDARGRKQSRYHPRWREVRDETKYERMVSFADALPVIRKQVEHDLALPGLPREKVLATIVSLLETTLIRVGNESYARENKSYGLTTMRNRHVDISGADVTFTFQGKSRVQHTVNLHDRRLARIIGRCADLPGYELFQYQDSDGTRHAIDSADVNEYLHTITGEHYTAKDFRTWAGSVLACVLLHEFDPFESATQAKKNVVQAVATVAARLGNTPSVCRKCYIHPTVIELYLGGIAQETRRRRIESKLAEDASALRQDEKNFLALLRKTTHA